MLIDDLSQLCLMGPVYIIYIVEDVGHMKGYLRKLIVQLCLTKVFVAAKSYFLFSTGLHYSFSDVAIILWQSLNLQLKFIVLHRKVFEFVMITSINVGT